MTDQGNLIPELDRKGLRQFGLVTGGVFALVFGLFFPWVLSRPFPVWPWAIFAVLSLVGLLLPETLRLVYRWWMRFAMLAGKVTTPIILGLVFFAIITPMGWLMKLFRKDTLHRKLDASLSSYRVSSKGARREDLENPY